MELSSITKENFDWKTYLRKYKDIKNVTDCESAWEHWVNKGKKQGRKFYTLTPDKDNNFYILTKEYIKRKNKNNNNNIACLSEDNIITDYVSNLKKKIYKMRRHQTMIKEEENNIIKEENNIIKEENNNIKEENNIIQEQKVNLDENKINVDKKVKVDENKVKLEKKKINLEKKNKSQKKVKEEWSNNSENSEIFFIDTNNDEWDNSSENSEKYFNKLKNNDNSNNKLIKLNNKTIKIIDEEKSNKSNTSNK